MASYGTTTHRLAATSAPPSSAPTGDWKGPTAQKDRKGFNFVCPFNIPSTPEAAALRIIKNLGHFGLYYIIFVWLILYISLIPERKVSLVYFVSTTVVTCLYLFLLREFPNSTLLHKIIDKRFVLFLVAILMAVELILTRAAIHLFVTLAAALPVILVHAVLWVRDDLVVNEENNDVGELVPLVHGGAGDAADASV